MIPRAACIAVPTAVRMTGLLSDVAQAALSKQLNTDGKTQTNGRTMDSAEHLYNMFTEVRVTSKQSLVHVPHVFSLLLRVVHRKVPGILLRRTWNPPFFLLVA